MTKSKDIVKLQDKKAGAIQELPLLHIAYSGLCRVF